MDGKAFWDGGGRVKIADRVHLARVANLGCIVCRQLGVEPETPCSAHHIRSGYGKGQRAPHTETIPLCGFHHQTGGYGHAYHAGPGIWQKKYGSEQDLLKQTLKELGL